MRVSKNGSLPIWIPPLFLIVLFGLLYLDETSNKKTIIVIPEATGKYFYKYTHPVLKGEDKDVLVSKEIYLIVESQNLLGCTLTLIRYGFFVPKAKEIVSIECPNNTQPREPDE